MSSLTQTDHLVLEQLSARTTLPVPSRVAVKLAWLYLIWSQRRQSRRALSRLDGHLLRDIGMTPKDAYLETRKFFWRP